MRYFLPPADDERPRGIPPVARAPRPDTLERPIAAPGAPDAGAGRLVRLVHLPAGAAAGYLARWSAEPPAAAPLGAPAPLAAAERDRPDRSPGGGTRRQRLVVAEEAAGALAGHWSAPEPLTPADHRSWERLLHRLAGAAGRAPSGWRA